MANFVPDGSGWIPGELWEDRKHAARAASRRNPDITRRILAGERRALTIQRPWANLIIAGHKTTENRSWASDHRGELVIHAGKAWAPAGAALAADLGITGFDSPKTCPGGFLGTVRLVDVHPADGCCASWGVQEVGTYHWVLADPVPFPEPVPGQGRLGLYWLPADLLHT